MSSFYYSTTGPSSSKLAIVNFIQQKNVYISELVGYSLPNRSRPRGKVEML